MDHRSALACVLFCVMVGARAFAGEAITFHDDVLPILQASCVNCHQPGQIAPMPLRTFKEVRPWAKSIKEAVVRREMPPFQAGGPVGRYLYDPRLTEAEIDIVAGWVDAGCPPGSPPSGSLEPAAQQSGLNWVLGEPDIVTNTQPYTIKARVSNDYGAHMLDYVFPEDLWIGGIDIRHSDPRLVHHANLATLRSLDDLDAEIAAFDLESSQATEAETNALLERRAAMLERARKALVAMTEGEQDVVRDSTLGILSSELMGIPIYGWLPGTDPRTNVAALPILIPKGARLFLESHYTLQDAASVSTSTVGLYLFDGEITEKRLGYIVQPPPSDPIQIPPHTAEYGRTFEHTLETDALIDMFSLHMHYRGWSGSVTLTRPGGASEVIFDVPRYDFNWQRTYQLAEPIFAPRGSRLTHAATWNNSASNPRNPNPKQFVRSGLRTEDEMWISTLQYTVPGGLERPIRVKNGREIR